MKILNKNNIEIKSLEDYKLYAPPKEEGQWKEDHSAMEFAKKVVNGSFQNELSAIIPNIQMDIAYPEYLSYFDDFGGPRNHDLACLATKDNEAYAICCEAKATESFGSTTVGKELDNAEEKLKKGENTHIPERINGLCLKLFNKSTTDDIRKVQYQLLHATAGTIAFAKEMNVKKAIFIIYQLETDKTNSQICNDHFAELESYVKLYGKNISKNNLCLIKNIDEIELSILYIQREKDK